MASNELYVVNRSPRSLDVSASLTHHELRQNFLLPAGQQARLVFYDADSLKAARKHFVQYGVENATKPFRDVKLFGSFKLGKPPKPS